MAAKKLYKAVLLMGPTATGKTELALKLAGEMPIEIISVDSALVYRDMNIGTAKPDISILESIPHHLVDILSPLQSYSLASFINDSISLIKQISARGNLPVLVGGTMLYFNGLLKGISQLPEADAQIRHDLELRAASIGYAALHAELAAVDKLAAARIMPTDKQRIIRALEVFYLTGVPLTKLQQDKNIQLSNDIDFLSLAIIPSNRELLHARINKRFQNMLESGFIDEVCALQQKYPELSQEHSSMRSVGYYQVWQHLSGIINYQALCETGMAATRQLAKRQITWLRQMPAANLDDGSLDIEHLFSELCAQIKKHVIISTHGF